MPAPDESQLGTPPEGSPGLRRSLTPHAGLLSLLTIATFFEGFDTKLAGLVQPLLGREFNASTEQLGLVLGLSSLGMVLAFFVIHLADWIGRRPVFLGALCAYALLTLATAFSPNLIVYTALQFFARMAMVVELSLAYLILSEFTDRREPDTYRATSSKERAGQPALSVLQSKQEMLFYSSCIERS